MKPLLALAAAGCTAGPRFVSEPRIVAADATAPLTPFVDVELTDPAFLELRVTDARGVRVIAPPDDATSHHVPLYGSRAGDTVQVEIRALGDRGFLDAGPLEAVVGDLPEDFPIVEQLVEAPRDTEPGLRLLSVTRVDPPFLGWSVALDETGAVVWALAAPFEISDLRREPSGSLYALGEEVGLELDPLGHVATAWGAEPPPGLAVDLFVPLEDARWLHHELYPLPGEEEFLGLTVVKRRVPSYPCSYEEPRVDCGPADIKDIRFLHFRRDGEVLVDQSLGDLLDPFRIGYLSLDRLSGGAFDWAHGNAVIPRPGGGVLVSLRHQDALVALDDEGGLQWILGDPAGWSEAFAPYLLAAVGDDFVWPYHVHGPQYDPDGVLWAFDNHNDGHTPYTLDPPGEPTSRVVGMRVDEVARTVEIVAVYDETSTGRLFSRAFGDARHLPETGDLLGAYGMPVEDDLGGNGSQGFGSRAARVVEWAPDGRLVSDVRLRSDAAVTPGGWRVFRAVPAPSLYADGVERWVERAP